jgi:hypothetical protein
MMQMIRGTRDKVKLPKVGSVKGDSVPFVVSNQILLTCLMALRSAYPESPLVVSKSSAYWLTVVLD